MVECARARRLSLVNKFDPILDVNKSYIGCLPIGNVFDFHAVTTQNFL